MTRASRVGALAAVAVGLAAVAPSEASAEVRLGLGADYWLDDAGIFALTLAVDTRVARSLSVGGRFGGLLTTGGPTVGAPLDLAIRLSLARHRVYLEGLFGPWVFFSGDALRFHAAVGFGLRRKAFDFGLEVGYLEPSPMLGVRFAWRI